MQRIVSAMRACRNSPATTPGCSTPRPDATCARPDDARDPVRVAERCWPVSWPRTLPVRHMGAPDRAISAPRGRDRLCPEHGADAVTVPAAGIDLPGRDRNTPFCEAAMSDSCRTRSGEDCNGAKSDVHTAFLAVDQSTHSGGFCGPVGVTAPHSPFFALWLEVAGWACR